MNSQNGNAKYKEVFFEPWVGKEFKGRSPNSPGIMILGESHYGQPVEMKSTFTVNLMNHVVQGSRRAFWTKAAGVFLGRRPNDSEYRSFWNSVMFYNYIQEFVGDKARMRPMPTMWKRAAPALNEVLHLHQPHFVLVLGKALWENLPQGHAEKSVTIPGDTKSRPVRFISTGAHNVALFAIKHPQSPGWKYAEWTPWVLAGLAIAQQALSESSGCSSNIIKVA